MSSKTIFGLLRHAETQWNRDKRIQGQQDTPLTAAGRASASQWGQRLESLHWDHMLVSDLGRAGETADLINASIGLSVQTDARLREQDWGDWTAMAINDIKTGESDRLAVLEAAGWGFTPPGGESRRQVLTRAIKALQAAARSRPDQRILVICHEGVVKCLIYHLSGRRFLTSEGRLLKPQHLHYVSVVKGGLQLDQVNALDLKGSP